MKIFKTIYILAILFSCSRENEDKLFQNKNTSTIQIPLLKQEASSKIIIDASEYWVLKNKLSDDKLFFNKYYNKNDIPFERWVFIFSDNNIVNSFINYSPSCAMGQTIIDTTIWNETNKIVKLIIKGVHIGSSNFEYSYHLEEVLYSNTEYIFKKIK